MYKHNAQLFKNIIVFWRIEFQRIKYSIWYWNVGTVHFAFSFNVIFSCQSWEPKTVFWLLCTLSTSLAEETTTNIWARFLFLPKEFHLLSWNKIKFWYSMWHWFIFRYSKICLCPFEGCQEVKCRFDVGPWREFSKDITSRGWSIVLKIKLKHGWNSIFEEAMMQ